MIVILMMVKGGEGPEPGGLIPGKFLGGENKNDQSRDCQSRRTSTALGCDSHFQAVRRLGQNEGENNSSKARKATYVSVSGNAKGGLRTWDWHKAMQTIRDEGIDLVVLQETGVHNRKEKKGVEAAVASAAANLPVSALWSHSKSTTGYLLTLACGRMARNVQQRKIQSMMSPVQRNDESLISSRIQILKLQLHGRNVYYVHVYGVPNDGFKSAKTAARSISQAMKAISSGLNVRGEEYVVLGDLNWLATDDDKITVHLNKDTNAFKLDRGIAEHGANLARQARRLLGYKLAM